MRTKRFLLAPVVVLILVLSYLTGIADAQERDISTYKYLIRFRNDGEHVTRVNFFVSTEHARLWISRIYDISPVEDGWKVVVWTISEDIKLIQVYNISNPELYVPSELVLLEVETYDRIKPSPELIDIYSVEFVIDGRYSVWVSNPAIILDYLPNKVYFPIIKVQ